MGMGVLTVFNIRQQATSAIYADVRTTTLTDVTLPSGRLRWLTTEAAAYSTCAMLKSASGANV